jgi:hypothetical protein
LSFCRCSAPCVALGALDEPVPTGALDTLALADSLDLVDEIGLVVDVGSADDVDFSVDDVEVACPFFFGAGR